MIVVDLAFSRKPGRRGEQLANDVFCMSAQPSCQAKKKKVTSSSTSGARVSALRVFISILQRVVDPLFPFLGVLCMQGVGVPPDRFSMPCSYSRALDNDTEMR